MWAKHDRQSRHGRFEHIVAPHRNQGAADEGDVRRGVERAQFPNRIQHEHLVRATAGNTVATPYGAKARRSRQSGHRRKALRMPRHKHQQQPGEPLPQAAENGQQAFLLPGMGAGRDDDRPAAEQFLPQTPTAGDKLLTVIHIELDIARHGDFRRVRADCGKALGVLWCLCRNRTDRGQRRPDQAPDVPVSDGGPTGQPCIRDH